MRSWLSDSTLTLRGICHSAEGVTGRPNTCRSHHANKALTRCRITGQTHEHCGSPRKHRGTGLEPQQLKVTCGQVQQPTGSPVHTAASVLCDPRLLEYPRGSPLLAGNLGSAFQWCLPIPVLPMRTVPTDPATSHFLPALRPCSHGWPLHPVPP